MVPRGNGEIERGDVQESFLSVLLTKQAMVLSLQAAGLHVDAALVEVERQIKQACSGNLITGEGVTKSGDED